MTTVSALLTLGAGNSQITGEFSSQRPGTRRFGILLWSAPEQTVESTINTSVIWDALHSLSYHCNERHVIFQNSKATNDYVSLPWTRFRHSKWQAICNLITFFHLASVFENMISRIVLCFDWMIHFNIRMLIHLFSSNTVSISYMTTSLSILTIVFSQISRTITPTTIFILLTNASVLSCLFSV